MSLLSNGNRQLVRDALAQMTGPVSLVFFTQTIGCEGCLAARRVLDEVVPLNEQLAFEEYNVVLDKETAATYGVDRAPAIAVVGARDYGIRFYGAPTGYEFMTLVDAILLASTGDSGLSAESRELLGVLTAPVDLQVFVTPT